MNGESVPLNVTDLQSAGVPMTPCATVYEGHQPYEVVVQLTTIWQPETSCAQHVAAVVDGLHRTRRAAVIEHRNAGTALLDALMWKDLRDAGHAERTRNWAARTVDRCDALLSEWEVGG